MKRLSALLLAGLLLSQSAPALAQDATDEACLKEVYASLLREQLFLDSVIFGQKASEDLPQGSIRYDTFIKPWIKTAQNEWKSYDSKDGPQTDAGMDGRAYPPLRRGLLETKKALSSELIPPLLQSMRAFQCRLRAVCTAALQSRAEETPQSFRVEEDGCIPLNVQRFNSCRSNSVLDGTRVNESNLNVQVGVCDDAATEMFKRRANMLALVMSYDASYRSFLQFAGIAQGFGEALRKPVLGALSDTVMTLRNFNGVSCFTPQCDE